MSKKNSLLLKYIAIALAVLCSGSFFLKKEQKVNSPPYKIVEARTGNVEQQIMAVGEITPIELVHVGAQVSGQITKMNAKLGQFVEQGELIAEIDATPQLNRLRTVKTQITIYYAQLASKKVSVKEAQQSLARQKELAKQRATSQEAVDKAENALALAQAATAEKRALIEKTQIEFENAKADLEYTKIVSPLSGTVVAIPVKTGQTVNAVQSAPTIVQIADLTKFEVKMRISEGDIANVRPGMKVSFNILSAPNQKYDATLHSVDPAPIHITNSKDGKSATQKDPIYYYGRLYVENHSRLLQIGMTAQCVITIKTAESVVVLPIDAIKCHGPSCYVWSLSAENIPIKKSVTTGCTNGTTIEITSGISVGDQVILTGMNDDYSACGVNIPL
ncbi:efflux RND transporter periplasmic adaptor subunit [Halodesulfovibrio sp.]|jgi:macrolide-specific efflux system membrane fusion protein|uniref:efflux RND transporter periplasmic adaptor subunit n=1 Tax=Halodesulfovibrio sp. TaxID=1912772 RepID=UPI0025DCA771|nr:efflux RND transporter periplasmic adaptor subunit [Halodesulfovibrio sp.]MCT4625457.1 efflux RND transporter periplasmic adaptor subunit [Halodesulfovibrio sp.]